jgi:cell division septal protein FtsQ
MKLTRNKKPAPAPTGRQRLRRDDAETAKTPAFSYRSSRSDSATSTGRKRQRQALRLAGITARNFWVQRFGLLILVVTVTVCAINVVTLSSKANVMPLTTGGKSTLLQNETVYEAAASRLLATSVWNQNKLTIDTQRLSDAMLKQFPELASVTVTMPLLAHRPIFYVQPATPALILTNTTGAYVLDGSGKTLKKAVSVAALNQPSLPTITDQSSLEVQVGRQALSSNNVAFMQEVITQLAAKRIGVAALTLPPAANQLDVQIAGQPYYVKFNLQGSSARQQAGTYIAMVNHLGQQKITPGKYVDVRVDGRAYYQ